MSSWEEQKQADQTAFTLARNLFQGAHDSIGGLREDYTFLVIQAELFFDFLKKNGIKKPVGLAEAETGIPWEVALSLLKPDELEKLKKYVAAYRAKHGDG